MESILLGLFCGVVVSIVGLFGFFKFVDHIGSLSVKQYKMQQEHSKKMKVWKDKMADEYQYLDEFKKYCKLYTDLQAKENEIKTQREQIKEAIGQWLENNNLKEYEFYENGKFYKAYIYSKTSKSVDYTYLEEVLDKPQYENAISFRETEVLTIRQMATSKSKSKKSAKKPKAPKETD